MAEITRISREEIFLEMAETLSKRSTCARNAAGAVIVNISNNPVGWGYNGPPSGQPHCQLNECMLTNESKCSRSIHAEKNAIDRAIPHPDARIFCTVCPCTICAKEIIRVGWITQVYFREAYSERDSIYYLLDQGIEVFQVTRSGYVTNLDTGKIWGN